MFEIGLERPAEQPRRIRVLDETSVRSKRTGDANAYCSPITSRPLELRDERCDGLDGGSVVVAWSIDAPTCDLTAAGERDTLNLRSTQINPDTHLM
jgi:hypothetical protein